MSESSPVSDEDSVPNTENRPSEEDILEKEVEFRQVGLGILKKWPFWVFLPLLVMALAGGYYLMQPERYEISMVFGYKVTETTKSAKVSFPSETMVRRRILSISLLEDLYPQYYSSDDTPREQALNIRRSLEFSRITNSKVINSEAESDSDALFKLTLTTTGPDTAARFLNALADTFVQSEYQRIRKEAKRRLETKQSLKQKIKNQYEDWKKVMVASTQSPDKSITEPNDLELVSRLGQNIGPIPSEVELLQRNTQYIEQLQSVGEDIFWLNYLLEGDLSLYEISPAESPGVKLDQNGQRKSVLAGVVTFLLLFFGVAFWEIL